MTRPLSPILIVLALLMALPITAPAQPAATTPMLPQTSGPDPAAPTDPTDPGYWRQAADARIEQIRKGDFRVQLLGPDGQPLNDSTVAVDQIGSTFHFGTAIAGDLDSDNPNEVKYRQFILDHFNSLVAENAMKWYATEKERGEITYDKADQYMQFAQEHGLTMRGHCLFWAKYKFVQDWIQNLSKDELREEMEEHISEIVPRYEGRLIAWDVNNEMLDGHFYERRLGEPIRAWMFTRARELDAEVPLFVNDYSILADRRRTKKIIEQIESLKAGGADVTGIGIQEHAAQRFHPTAEGAIRPEVIYESLEELRPLGLPIHLTEISVDTKDERRKAESLEVLLRMSFSHPSVEAFHLWGFWRNRHWKPNAALVEKDWTLLPAAEMYQRMVLDEWRTRIADAHTDDDGSLAFRGFFGTYRFATTTPDGQSLTGSLLLDQAAVESDKPLDLTLQPIPID